MITHITHTRTYARTHACQVNLPYIPGVCGCGVRGFSVRAPSAGGTLEDVYCAVERHIDGGSTDGPSMKERIYAGTDKHEVLIDKSELAGRGAVTK